MCENEHNKLLQLTRYLPHIMPLDLQSSTSESRGFRETALFSNSHRIMEIVIMLPMLP